MQQKRRTNHRLCGKSTVGKGLPVLHRLQAGKFDPQTVTAQEVLKGLEEVIASGEYELSTEFRNYCGQQPLLLPYKGNWSLTARMRGTGNSETVLAQSSITHRITAGTSMGIVGCSHDGIEKYRLVALRQGLGSLHSAPENVDLL